MVRRAALVSGIALALALALVTTLAGCGIPIQDQHPSVQKAHRRDPSPERARQRASSFPAMSRARTYFVDGNENTAPSRTPAEGQRCVMVFRFV